MTILNLLIFKLVKSKSDLKKKKEARVLSIFPFWKFCCSQNHRNLTLREVPVNYYKMVCFVLLRDSRK